MALSQAIECPSCEKSFIPLLPDYMCVLCREIQEGKTHPLVGKTITSVKAYDDMRGTVLYLDDGSSVTYIYGRVDVRTH